MACCVDTTSQKPVGVSFKTIKRCSWVEFCLSPKKELKISPSDASSKKQSSVVNWTVVISGSAMRPKKSQREAKNLR